MQHLQSISNPERTKLNDNDVPSLNTPKAPPPPPPPPQLLLLLPKSRGRCEPHETTMAAPDCLQKISWMKKKLICKMHD